MLERGMVYIDSSEHRQILQETQVFPVDQPDVARFDELMAEHHYLGFQRAAGQAIRYVAVWRGQWLALLLWASAAFKCKSRDQWIGWLPHLQWARLKYVVNNTRFLMLPDIRVPNLASRILRLNRERLSADWHQRYGSSVLLAETFVDPSRFRGSCYLADNWLALGQTRGFSRSGGKYTASHGQPKLIFIHHLHPRGRELLSDPNDVAGFFSEREVILDGRNLVLSDWSSLFEAFLEVRDTRTRKGRRHKLPSVLAIVTCAFLSGCRVIQEMELWGQSLPQRVLATLLCPKNKKTGRREAPSDSTILRVLQQINTANLDDVVSGWLTGVLQRQDEKRAKKQPANKKELRVISLDGKTLRGSHDGDEKKAVQLFSALWQYNGVVIAQVKIPDKTNEINAVAPLLGDKDIAGCVVTADAIHTQTKTARYVVERKKADYVLTVKANQPTLLANLQAIDDGFFSPRGVRN